MQKCIGSALLLVMLAAYPALGAAQRRGAARPAARSADRPSFGLELNWSSDVDFGIGGRAGIPLGSLFPKTPPGGIISFHYFFPRAPAGARGHHWEVNGDDAYRLTAPSPTPLPPL